MTRFTLIIILSIINLSVFGQFAPYSNTTNQVKIIPIEKENNNTQVNKIPRRYG